MNKLVKLGLIALLLCSCGTTETKSVAPAETGSDVTQTQEEIDASLAAAIEFDEIRGTFLTNLIQLNEIVLPADVEFDEYIAQTWNVSAFPLTPGSAELGPIPQLAFDAGSVLGNDAALNVLGIEFYNYVEVVPGVNNACEETTSTIENGERVGSGYGTYGFDPVVTYTTLDTGFDVFLKINLGTESFYSCCGQINSCSTIELPASEHVDGLKSFKIEGANENGFAIISNGYYIVFDNLP